MNNKTRTNTHAQMTERASKVAEQMIDYVNTYQCLPWQSGLVIEAVLDSIMGYVTDTTVLGSSGTPYSGANLILTAMAIQRNNWSCRHFFTFQRVKELGGSVTAGAKATYITRAVFSYFVDGKKITEKEAKEAREKGKEVDERYLGVKEYCVFNGEQTSLDWERIDAEDREKAKKKANGKERKFRRDASAEEILSAYTRGCDIYYTSTGSSDGYYSPSNDYIVLAPPTAYKSAPVFYSTLFHEMIHATSHQSRLNRKIGGTFGSSDYAKEELVAEFGASLLMTYTDSGVGQTFENSTSYVSGWAKRIEEEGADFSKILTQAVPKSIKAVEFILTNGEAA